MAGSDPLRGVRPSPTAANPGRGRRSTAKRHRALFVVGILIATTLLSAIALTLTWAASVGFKPPMPANPIPEEPGINILSPAWHPSDPDTSTLVAEATTPAQSSQAASPSSGCPSETDDDPPVYTVATSGAPMVGFSSVTASLLKCGTPDEDPRVSAVATLVVRACVPTAHAVVGCKQLASCESAASPASAAILSGASNMATTEAGDKLFPLTPDVLTAEAEP